MLGDFARECEDYLAASYNPDTGQYGILVEFPDPSEDLPLAISDCIHNLRSALDYIVFELAIKDSGTVQEGTQFPLDTESPKTTPDGHKLGWDVRVKSSIQHLSQPHRDIIEKMQPYNGVKWTKALKDISNPDKHRKLTAVKNTDELHGWSRPEGKGKRLPTGEHIQVDPTHTVRIELPDRNLPILPTLYSIQASVADTINLFKPEF